TITSTGALRFFRGCQWHCASNRDQASTWKRRFSPRGKSNLRGKNAAAIVCAWPLCKSGCGSNAIVDIAKVYFRGANDGQQVATVHTEVLRREFPLTGIDIGRNESMNVEAPVCAVVKSTYFGMSLLMSI